MPARRMILEVDSPVLADAIIVLIDKQYTCGFYRRPARSAETVQIWTQTAIGAKLAAGIIAYAHGARDMAHAVPIFNQIAQPSVEQPPVEQPSSTRVCPECNGEPETELSMSTYVCHTCGGIGRVNADGSMIPPATYKECPSCQGTGRVVDSEGSYTCDECGGCGEIAQE